MEPAQLKARHEEVIGVVVHGNGSEIENDDDRLCENLCACHRGVCRLEIYLALYLCLSLDPCLFPCPCPALFRRHSATDRLSSGYCASLATETEVNDEMVLPFCLTNLGRMIDPDEPWLVYR